jgi:hypothetical protein
MKQRAENLSEQISLKLFRWANTVAGNFDQTARQSSRRLENPRVTVIPAVWLVCNRVQCETRQTAADSSPSSFRTRLTLAGPAEDQAAGRVNRNVVPCPNVLFAHTSPPCD